MRKHDLIDRQVLVKSIKEYLIDLLEKGKTEVDITEFNVDIQNLIEKLPAENEWIPIEHEVPPNEEYILISFRNFSIPLIGRYESGKEGGSFYVGDEEKTCAEHDLYVNAWMPLPERYCD